MRFNGFEVTKSGIVGAIWAGIIVYLNMIPEEFEWHVHAIFIPQYAELYWQEVWKYLAGGTGLAAWMRARNPLDKTYRPLQPKNEPDLYANARADTSDTGNPTVIVREKPSEPRLPITPIVSDIDNFDSLNELRSPTRSIQPDRVDVELWSDRLPDDRVMSSQFFSQAELECKGLTCDCEYPGMSRTVMGVLDDLRQQFGPLVMMSGYRCHVHNNSIKGASNNSYHKYGRAGDVKPVNKSITPKQLYEYLTNKYPKQYGFGLYKTFVHVDDRSSMYGRKETPNSEWRQYAKT